MPEWSRSSQRRYLVLALSTVAVFMAFLDTTIVNVAFPAIRRSFASTSLPDLSWVLNAYNVVIAALLVPAGRLADRLGRRRIFFSGMALFLGASLICGVAPSAPVLIAARIVQGVGAAAIVPSSFAIVLNEFPVERRAMPTSVWAAAGAVAAATGPSLGGVLVDQAGWRWAFFVNLVIALLLIPARRVFSESRDGESRATPDFIGAGLVAISMGSIALGIVKAPDWGWDGPPVLALWACGAAILAAVVLRSRRHPSPVIEPALLRIPAVRAANAATFAFSIGFYALLLGNILFLTQVWHYSVLTAGFAVSPGPLVAAAAAALGGRLTDRLGPRPVAAAGLAGFACACLVYRGAGPAPDYAGHWLPAQISSGFSIGLVFAALTTGSVMDLPPGRVATGTALASCVRQLGAVLGIAGLIAVIGTPTPLTAMHAFEHAWLLMSITAAVACGVAVLMPGHRPGEAPVAEVPVPGEPLILRRNVEVEGARLSYLTSGDGSSPVVLVHGLLEDARTWRRLIPALTAGHTVIAPDLIGHGDSSGSEDVEMWLGGHAGALRRLLGELGHERVTLVGHALGAHVAVMFARLFPDRVERLVLLAPGGLRSSLRRALAVRALPGVGVALRGVTRAPVRGGLRAAAAVRRQRTGTEAHAEGLLPVPTLVLWGTRDRVMPVELGIAEDANAELVLLEGIGHLPHVSRPGFVGERIASFLSSDPSATAPAAGAAAPSAGAPAAGAAAPRGDRALPGLVTAR